MKTKKVYFTEFAYVSGILALALGTALMEKANFGMSMVVAPAYLLHLKISQFFPAYTFGMSEYVFQAVLLVLLSVVVKKFKTSYLFSFVTAVIYGIVLDIAMNIVSLMQFHGLAISFVCYISGMIVSSIGVSFILHTYILPEAYELFVKEVSAKYEVSFSKVKTIYDCCSCILAILLSFCFFGFGHFEGVKLGTVFCAIINGWLIGSISKILEKKFVFKDALKLRKLFNK